MPFVNIRLVKQVIADDPKGKKDKVARAVKDAICDVTGLTDEESGSFSRKSRRATGMLGTRTSRPGGRNDER
jgi:hypothetical protein